MAVVRVCDVCGDALEVWVTLGVPTEDRKMQILDLCSTDCVTHALAVAFGKEPPEKEEQQQQETLFQPVEPKQKDSTDESQRLNFVPQEKRLTEEERAANERRYREQAQRVTSQLTGVQVRGLGS